MKNCLIALGALLIAGTAAAAQAQVITTYLPVAPPAVVAPAPVVVAPAPAPVVFAPAPVVTYYARPIYPPVIAYPRRYVVPAPVVPGPFVYAVRPKVFVRGQPLRNAIRAATP